jgi:hypothetical protein
VTPSRRDLTAVIAIVAAVAASLVVVRLTASGSDQGNATTATDQPPSAWSTSAASDSAATPRSSTAPTPTATTTSVRREGQQRAATMALSGGARVVPRPDLTESMVAQAWSFRAGIAASPDAVDFRRTA